MPLGIPLSPEIQVWLQLEGGDLVELKDGMSGVLCVSGPCLMKGYLNQTEGSAGASFVTAPSGEK